MTLGTSGALGSVYDVIESNPDLAAGVEIGIAPMPSISGGGEGSTNVGGAALWLADTGDDAQKAASWDFAAWLTQPEQQARWHIGRSEEHTSELQSLMRISYAVFCLTNKNITARHPQYSLHLFLSNQY